MTDKQRMKRILITPRAWEVLKLMVEHTDPEAWPFTPENISEWIMAEWDDYCGMNGEPDVEVG